MSVRLAMLTASEMPGITVTALCAQMGISRNTFYKLRKRFAKEGPEGLAPRSRRPLSSPGKVSLAVEMRICRLRESPEVLDTGAEAIYYLLRRDGFSPLPSVRTIHRVLVRNGLVVAQPQKRPKASCRRFEYDAPNGCWQIDATEWRLRSGRKVWIMDVLDDHSRVMLAAVAVAGPTAAAAWRAFCRAAAGWGLPAKVLSDNGPCFTGRPGSRGERGVFEANLAALGITASHSSPNHPQTCGKLERAHQTLKKWLRRLRRARTLAELQAQLDRFCRYYNHHRPHRALAGATPAERFAATPPDRPALTGLADPLATPVLVIGERRVNSRGTLNIAGVSIAVGSRWTAHSLTAIRYGQQVTILDGTRLVRTLTIDPTRQHQPLTTA
jgi:transposase InsO family protein